MAARKIVETAIPWILISATVLFVAALAGIGSGWLTGDPPAVSRYSSPGTAPPQEPIPDLATGAEVYASECAGCHGADLSGGVGPALGPGSSVAGFTTDQIRSTILAGPGVMPSFGDRLQPAEVEAVVAFVRHAQEG